MAHSRRSDSASSLQSDNTWYKRSTYRVKTFLKHLISCKSMEKIQQEIDTQNELKRVLNWVYLMGIGIGATIGVGIFLYSGEAAAKYCGPSVIISFILTGIVALLAALSFAELGSFISHSGSVFTYTYATLGEYAAWFIGWNSALMYLFDTLTLTAAWSKYLVRFIELVSDYNVTKSFVNAPIGWNASTESFFVTGDAIDLPAIAINIGITIIIVLGIRPTAIVILVLTVIKVIIVLLFIFACCGYVNRKNYDPFIPSNKGSFDQYGVTGLLKASTHVFFAYVGFDVISTVAQETKLPSRNVPIATIGTTMITMLLYIGISTVMVGLVPYSSLDSVNPLVNVIDATPFGLWLKILMTLGGLAGLTTVSFAIMLSQTRIFYAMAHDGLLPSFFAQVHSKTKAPWVATLINGVFCSIFSGILPVDILGETTSIGALITYVFVHISLIMMRYKNYGMAPSFRVPLGNWLLPSIGSILCILLLAGVGKGSGFRFLVCTALGQIVYFGFGFWHSKEQRYHRRQREEMAQELKRY